MEIKTFGVIGAGTMGTGIAQVAAVSGFDLIVHDINDDILSRSQKIIDKSLSKLIEKGKIDRDKDDILSRINFTTEFNDLSAVDFAVEAAFENLKVKKDVLQKLDKICRPDVIITSNTSSISITRLAALTGRPDKFMGMHFMNPVPLMVLVELIKGMATSQETYDQVEKLAIKMDKVPVEAHDFPGFIANRILMPMINEAVFALMEGVGTVENIDQVMKLGMNHPMGPLALADLIGLDVDRKSVV
jgi:3-hydroxybutyryl-CoA dehydrogenase